MNFSSALDRATNLLEQRRVEEAIKEYQAAAIYAATPVDEQKVWHQMAIAHRLNGSLSEAADAFRQAAIRSSDPVTLARVNRDDAMNTLDIATSNQNDMSLIEEAEMQLLLSHETLYNAGEPIESMTSYGFYGRALLIKGLKKSAFEVIQRADNALSNTDISGHNPQYELNNLIWLVRASKHRNRLSYAARVWRLSRQLGQSPRMKEYLVLLIGGDTLYRFVKSKVKK